MKTLIQNMNCSRGAKFTESPYGYRLSGLKTHLAPHRDSREPSGLFLFVELDGIPKFDSDKVQLRMQPSNTASRDGINASLECCKRTGGIRVETAQAASRLARQPVRLTNVLTEGADLELGRKGLTDLIRDKSLFAFAQGQINQ